MTDKVEEIRERHKRVQQDGDLATPPVSMAGQVAARDAHEDRATLLAENDRLREALTSIARNTCCDRCQEAALVARRALKRNP